jgi:hypothetical protein
MILRRRILALLSLAPIPAVVWRMIDRKRTARKRTKDIDVHDEGPGWGRTTVYSPNGEVTQLILSTEPHPILPPPPPCPIEP